MALFSILDGRSTGQSESQTKLYLQKVAAEVYPLMCAWPVAISREHLSRWLARQMILFYQSITVVLAEC
jgi:hypothetical protein